jgi:hypothetical protein
MCIRHHLVIDTYTIKECLKNNVLDFLPRNVEFFRTLETLDIRPCTIHNSVDKPHSHLDSINNSSVKYIKKELRIQDIDRAVSKKNR